MTREYSLIIRPQSINFFPSTVAEEVLQNVYTICSTPKYSVPMDRELGVDATFVDVPMSSVGAKYKSQVIQAVRKFEPRARVTRIEYYRDEEGHMFYPQIYLKIVE